jgi:hypothetical protein
MKVFFALTTFAAISFVSMQLSAQQLKIDPDPGKVIKSADHKSAPTNLYLDIHHIGPGKVTYEAVAGAHSKDLAVEKKYGVHFIKYWVDETAGTVYCLSSSADTASIRKTHAEAHGLLPEQILLVTGGTEAMVTGEKNYFLDVHELGAGKVTAKDVEGAHQKDLAVQQKYGVNFINYWVDEKDGRVVCLSQAPDSTAVIKTHTEAHGLIPVSVVRVKQGE